MARLVGKTALITGATGFMGGAFAEAFAREGADLVLTGRRQEALRALAQDLTQRLGRKTVTIAADMTKPDDVARLAEETLRAVARLDVVLLSSQPANTFAGDLLTTPEALFAEMHEMIVWGPLRLMRALAPAMMAQGGGSVISVISSTGLNPTPGLDAYGLAKGTLFLLTKYMAREWGKGGIRANAINPGTIAGRGGEEQMRAMAEKTGTLARISLGRIGTNADVMGAALYLASDESRYTSGQLISIDGGRV